MLLEDAILEQEQTKLLCRQTLIVLSPSGVQGFERYATFRRRRTRRYISGTDARMKLNIPEHHNRFRLSIESNAITIESPGTLPIWKSFNDGPCSSAELRKD
jgi:hypothetical protein